MTQEELARLLRDKLTLTATGEVVAKDESVHVTQEGGDYAIQIGHARDVTVQQVTLAAEELRRLLTRPLPAVAPAPPAHFVGREPELARLKAALTQEDAPQAIIALRGLGGIGKTALAAQLAAELDGQLPGGVFWADLPAHCGDPLPILAAWAGLCGQDVSGMTTRATRAQAVRGILAWRVRERGRALAVLDDVRPEWLDGAQVLQAALPPGVPVLITTREGEMARALRSRVVRLDTLAPTEARGLVETLSEGALNGDAARRVAALCGYLPLALELAAGAAAEEGGDWLLGRLSQAATRLDALELEGAQRKAHSVRLTFDISYDGLAGRHPETARVLTRLAVFAPAPIDPARLAGVLAELEGGLWRRISRLLSQGRGRIEPDAAQVGAADAHLRRLARWGLVRRDGARYGLHPLLRDYAAERLAEAGEQAATAAVHQAHYLAYAEAHKQPTPGDYDALEAEQLNVLAAMDRAYDQGDWGAVRRFAWALCRPVSGYLGVRGYWAELQTRLEQAIHAAESSNNRYDLAAFTEHRATLLLNTGDLTTAQSEYHRVLNLWQAQGNRKGEAIVMHQLGMLAQDRGDYKGARGLYRQGLEINEKLGDWAVIASTLHHLGMLAQAQGDYERARGLYRQSLEIRQELGERAGIASSLGQLAILAKDEGNQAKAERLYRQAIALSEELGDVVGMSINMFNLALLYEGQSRLADALPLLERVVEIAERVSMPQAEDCRQVLERVREKLTQDT